MHRTFLNLCLCFIFHLIKIVVSKKDTDDILSLAKAAKYNIEQVQHLPDNFFSFTNMDIQIPYNRIKRETPDWERRDCDCGDGAITFNCIYGIHPDGGLCRCTNNKIVLNGKCTDCECPNGICNAALTDDCKCLKGFGLQNGTCVECDCGQKKQFCHFVEGLQFCNCDNDYVSINERCDDCVCGSDELCMKRPIGICVCPKGSGIWTDECDAKCDCSTAAKGCMFVGPQKICTCMPGKAKLDGVCVDCDCGENSECEFVDGEKICSCKDGYEMHNEICEECYCGDGHSCTFKNGSSVCLCAENHYEQNGTCKECSCDDPNERCEIIDGLKACICKEKFLKVNGTCTECWCGESHACDIVDGKKVCLCRRGFADYNGKCEQCDCGANYRFCEFQNGKKECECVEGFTDNNGICQECFCGKDSTCFFEDGKKMCICPHAQIQRNGSCSAICLDDTCDRGTCEVGSDGFYCNCETGYSGHRCDEEVVLSQGAIYIISVLSAVTLFWVILLLVFIIRKRNRYRYYRNEKLDTTMNILNEDQPDTAM